MTLVPNSKDRVWFCDVNRLTSEDPLSNYYYGLSIYPMSKDERYSLNISGNMLRCNSA